MKKVLRALHFLVLCVILLEAFRFPNVAKLVGSIRLYDGSLSRNPSLQLEFKSLVERVVPKLEKISYFTERVEIFVKTANSTCPTCDELAKMHLTLNRLLESTNLHSVLDNYEARESPINFKFISH